jgi:acetyl-CoA synthetase
LSWEPIRKSRPEPGLIPNLQNYADACRRFSWQAARNALDGLPGGGLNIAFEAVDRHVVHGRGDRLAIRWVGRDGARLDVTYAELCRQSNRFANVLSDLGIAKGECVFSLCDRPPVLYTAVLGTFKTGAVFTPLFSAFGPEPVRARMEIGRATALVTTPSLYRRKVEAWRHELPSLKHVLVMAEPGEAVPPGTVNLGAALAAASDTFPIVASRPEDRALIHFTSGTTGRPKGAIHVHEAVVAHHATGFYALDLHPEDTYWCTADPGWVTGMSYGIISPLTHGVTMVVDEAEFDPVRWYDILEREKVSVWYTAPTAIRMLMRAGAELAAGRDLSHLRFLASVGEPLNPEAVVWGQETFGRPFHDNWWQTETGGIMIANYAAMDVKPGSMGRPLPGIEAGIVSREEDGTVRAVEDPMAAGELALRPGWPSMFRGYLGEPERYAECFAGGWYLTGDLAMRDEDGYFWFLGRADDMIKSAGHLIGPFEVESALMEHPAVAEAGVIGIPDPVAGETVKAFVALKPGFEADDALRMAILAHARKRLGAVAPRDVAFRNDLPKTRSGKIMRRLLKARELGLPEGDTSTLEGSGTASESGASAP